MTAELSVLQKKFIQEFNQFAQNYFNSLELQLPQINVLWQSLKYSFDSGGKRFRPFLAYLVAQSGPDPQNIFSWALAVEMIHTYSLIHDDLPCMDNDDFRRGKPTNHKIFGDDIALLAGDAFLTEAFAVISSGYKHDSEIAIQLISLLSKNAGPLGMVGGQILDMKSHSDLTFENLELMHILKTGALIQAAVVGAGVSIKATDLEIESLKKFGSALGLAFQIKDDILDADDKAQDFKSYISKLGLEKTQNQLVLQSEKALMALSELKNFNTHHLVEIIKYNQNRDV